MTCRMAAGQQRKQLRNPNLHEQSRTKKKKRLDSSDNILCLSSQVNLEWDLSKKAVVAKKEQIGLTWTNMLPFVCSVTKSSAIADVVSVPSEIFDLDNLSEVLTYEVWTTYLSEPERKFLSQFLPSDLDIEQVVHSLLMGENHHFGNPYLKWSSSLCAGNLHPDVVLHREKKFNFNKRPSYYEINKYHTNMIEVLKKWRERWLNCKDPEKLLSEEFIEDKRRKLEISAESAKLPSVSKGEMSFNHDISNSDSIKYLSCIKLTRSQFQLVKNLKFSSDGIQRKSLIHVLGDVNSFHVQSYDKFEAEEKKKLHEHWLLIAMEAIPKASRVYKESKLLKDHCLKSLGIELTQKRKLILGKDKKLENLESLSQESVYGATCFDQHKHAPDVQDSDKDVKLIYKVMNDNHLEHIPSISTSQEIVCTVNDEVIGEGTSRQDDGLLPISESLYRQNAHIELENSNSSMKDIWPSSSLPNSSYHHSNHEFMSADDLSLGRKQIHKEHQAHIIDVEGDFPESGVASSFDKASMFCPSVNQDHNEMLPAFPNGSGMLPSYAHEQINNLQQAALPSCLTGESLSDSGQFAGQFQGQPQLSQQNGFWQKGSYMHQALNHNVYSTERYLSKGHFLSVDQQGFSAVQSSENSGSLGYNWFPTESQVYNNHWSGVDSFSNNHCVGHEGSANGNLSSLFSNKLLRPSFNTAVSEQYAPARNFVCGALPAPENTYSYAQPELANVNGDNTAVALPLRNGSLMNFPFQNSGFPNLGSKHF